MADLADRLEIKLVEVEGKRNTVAPTLSLDFRVSPNSDRIDVRQLQGRISFLSPDATITRDGPQIEFNPVNLSEIRNTTIVTGLVQLDYQALEQIEELRGGETLKVRTDISISGSRHNADELEEGTTECSLELIPAQWSEVLDTIGYHDTRVSTLQLGVGSVAVRDTLAAAQASVAQAQQKHDEGDYPGAITDCRRSIERLRTLDDDIKIVLDERKADDLDSILGPFESGFLGSMTHPEEKTSVETALRRDSDFAIAVTKAALRYVATAIEEGDS